MPLPPQSSSASFAARLNGETKTLKRRGRGVLIEPRRAQTIGWRTAFPLSQCACFRRKPLERQGRSQRKPRFPRCAFLGYFLCTSKESNKENLSPAALWLARCRKAMEFMPAGAPAAHNAGGFSFFRSFLCVSQRNEPKKRAEGRHSLWLPSAAARGRRHWL